MIKTEKTEKKNTPIKQSGFVVTIGASAGGLEAIHEFFDNVPENNKVAFIIIQHLSPDHKSLLVELVGKHTQMQVYEAEHGKPLLENSVYVIPNNKIMTLSNDRLQLADKVIEKAPNTAIDTFLLSLAKEKREKSIAIILSGTGSDGTKGIEAIKEAGGMVMVQDPATSKFDGMPNSAIATGCPDFILPPELMPEELFTFIREAPMPVLKSGKVDEIQLETVFKLVYKYTGCDFHSYKEATILRRISRRMAQAGCKELEDYVRHLQAHPQECKLLGKDFLIGVTRFFRDKMAFDALVNEVFPAIVANKNDGDTIKIWATACSTGEEAYSIAMTLDRFLKKIDKHLQVKIFATDVDEQAVDYAARGTYPASIAGDVDADILEEFFIKHGKKYQIRPDLRKQIVFARHNIVKDPPFIKNDLVSCRNMLIYMTSQLQEKVLNSIHYSLNPNGYLLMGPSETPSGIKENLEEVNRKWKIFRKGEDAKSISPISLLPMPDYVRYVAKKKKTDMRHRDQPMSEGLQSALNEIITEDLGYAALYIDKNYIVQEAAGNFKNYLSLPEKSLSLNLLKMVSGDLSIALNTAIRKAYKENKKVILENTRIREEERIRHINICVKPGAPLSVNPHTLIILGENNRQNGHSNGNGSANGNGHTDHKLTLRELPESEMIIELQSELKEAKLNLQAAIESMETANEEMQSSNEELLSANEELQSSNEELQSLNEELHTLNTEHQAKINELLELNDDLNNYFRSTDIGQIFVDSNLRIRKFNPAAIKLINLIDTDLGRPIAHISTNLRYNNLINDIQQSVKGKTIIEQEIKLSNGQTTLMRIFPYIRQDKHIAGAVITFVDITAIKNLNNILQGVFDTSINAILALQSVRNEENQITDFTISAANEQVSTLFGKSGGDLLNKSFREQLPVIANDDLFEKYTELVEGDQRLQLEYNYTSNGEEHWLRIMASKMEDGLAVTFTEITEKKIAEENLQKSYNELIEARNKLKQLNEGLQHTNHELAASNDELQQFTSVASHDLKEPLRKIHMFSNMLKEKHFEDDSHPGHLYIDRIVTSTERMIQLVNDLLSFSKLSAESLLEPLDLNIILEQVLSDLEFTILEKKADVVADDLPVIDAIPGQIRQVFQNILSNALKFSKPNETPSIRITGERIKEKNFNSEADETGNYFRICIADNGIGFDDKYLPKIFTIFQRLHTRQEYEGTGIGLAICKKIIEKHNGILTATSRENVGSTFIIVLPLKQVM